MHTIFSINPFLLKSDVLSIEFTRFYLQAAFYEILSGLWVRNGLQIRGQAMSYIQCHFGNSMVDADIFLLQVCATQLAPGIVLPTIFERYERCFLKVGVEQFIDNIDIIYDAVNAIAQYG